MIHLAFGNDFSSPDALAKAVAEESAALATLGEELAGSGRPFVTVSGTPRAPGRASTEADPLPTDGPFRLALEQAEAGTSWHAVADEGDKVRDIASVIGRRLGLPVEPVPAETYGTLGPIFAADQPSSSTHTRRALGWEPKHPSLLEDLENIQP